MADVTCRLDEDGVAVVALDDGRHNVLSLDLFAQLEGALDEAADARALVLAGRPGTFSAGLDLKHVAARGAAGVAELGPPMARVALRLWTDPRPTVAAATGHAIAGGCILAMVCDHVVAAEGDGRWGLTETAVGLELPEFALGPARLRLAPRHVNQHVLPGDTLDVDRAVAVGYADEAVPGADCIEHAVREARRRADLPAHAYAANKHRLRGPAADAAAASFEADLAQLVASLDT